MLRIVDLDPEGEKACIIIKDVVARLVEKEGNPIFYPQQVGPRSKVHKMRLRESHRCGTDIRASSPAKKAQNFYWAHMRITESACVFWISVAEAASG